ncbi:hypothetical protein D9M68_211260 [compost metagenome]
MGGKRSHEAHVATAFPPTIRTAGSAAKAAIELSGGISPLQGKAAATWRRALSRLAYAERLTDI